MSEEIIYDDPLWEYTLATKLMEYIPSVQKWWDTYDEQDISRTGVFDLVLADGTAVPPGLFIRTTNTAARSPIKNIQVFPFVPTSYLQLSAVPGGVNRMVERICSRGLTLKGFKCIEKHNLPSTYHKGQFIALIPEKFIEGKNTLGKYVYLTAGELSAIASGVLPPSVQLKGLNFVNTLNK